METTKSGNDIALNSKPSRCKVRFKSRWMDSQPIQQKGAKMATRKKMTIAKIETPKKPAAASKKTVAKDIADTKISPEERQKMIEREAYFLAEKQGFQGDPKGHWMEAVKKIDALLAKKK
jgi:hypothetical protein